MTPLLAALTVAAVVAGATAGTETAAREPVHRQVDAAPRSDGAWPLDPRPDVAEGFDPPDMPWGSGHRGVDLAGRVGQVVRSALPGVVTFAGRIAGRGVVTVTHGALRTTYEPVTASVEVGDPVERAAAIGTLELYGSHCLPAACLHWGARRGEQYVDPLALVGAAPRPVRLLPPG